MLGAAGRSPLPRPENMGRVLDRLVTVLAWGAESVDACFTELGTMISLLMLE